MSRRFLAYIEKIFKLTEKAGRLIDKRANEQVSTSSCFMFALCMFVLGKPSLNSFEERLNLGHRKKLWKKIFSGRAPSADTVGYCFERLELDGLRDLLHHIYTTLQRNHIIEHLSISGYRVLAIDGIEISSSDIKHCDSCCERKIKTKQGERLQYYHNAALGRNQRKVVACEKSYQFLKSLFHHKDTKNTKVHKVFFHGVVQIMKYSASIGVVNKENKGTKFFISTSYIYLRQKVQKKLCILEVSSTRLWWPSWLEAGRLCLWMWSRYCPEKEK